MNEIIKSDDINIILQAYKILLKRKDTWLFIQIEYKNNCILIKQFNKYVQIFKVNGLHANYTGDIGTQKRLIENLKNCLERC